VQHSGADWIGFVLHERMRGHFILAELGIQAGGMEGLLGLWSLWSLWKEVMMDAGKAD